MSPNDSPKVKIEIPKVIRGPETLRILKELATMPPLKSMTAEEAKRQTDIHLESARRNLLQADRKNPPA
jgi:hypothetical protein